LNQTFFPESSDSLSAYLKSHLLAIYHDGLGLQVGLPYFFGVSLRKANVVTKLLALASYFTLLHKVVLYLFYHLGSRSKHCYNK
jgi:hypothetical protein